jgi:uncharacterized phage-associated protein
VPVLSTSTVPASAHDVAAELRRRLGAGVGVVKLHKLLYYAQGWHVAWQGEPLFRERIMAWANGPVVAEVWADEKHRRPRPAPQRLTGDELATIDHVVDRYGGFTGKDLIRLTHAEAPWRDVSESDDPASVTEPEISLDALARFFRSDDDHVRRTRAVEAARARSDVYSLTGDPPAAGLDAAVTRALAGDRVRDRRP